MNLVKIELRRLGHRRRVWVAIALVPLIAVAIGIGTFRSHSSSPPDLAAAQAMASEQERDCRASMGSDGFTSAELDEMCHAEASWFVVDPRFQLQSLLGGSGTVEWSTVVARQARQSHAGATTEVLADTGETIVIEAEVLSGPTEHPASGRGGLVPGVATIMLLMVAAVTASHIGSEWRDGTIESQLVWQPDRRRLIGAKLATVGLAASGFAAVFVGAITLATVPALVWRGSSSHTGATFWLDVAVTTGRLSLAAAALAVLTAAVTTLFRSAMAGVATIFGLAIVGMVVSQTGWRISGLDLFSNVAAWITTSDVSRWVTFDEPTGGTSSWYVVAHGWWAAGVVVAAYCLVSSLAGISSFMRRDVS